MSYVAEPPSASALYSLEAPPTGGDTGFCNMYLAYESLPAELRRQIEGRGRPRHAPRQKRPEARPGAARGESGGGVCRHDASRNSAGELRRGFVDAADASQTVGADHPIVRTHPVTRRTAQFRGRR